ncbi:hypothetical protein [Shewanella maritima]|uniref:hypothetical protein n=1 Tax=Shewanella maritima TaxID=2520507 RepID=UPI003736C3ED
MESDLAIITLVVLIVTGTTASEMFKYYMKAKQANGGDNISDLKAQNKALVERVQVLEKLVTDEGFEVKQQINKL